jgi:Flp pilus assembly protein TadG
LSGKDRHERGASAVEFALLLPVLTALIFGLIDFGFVFAQQIALNNAARDASRVGVVQSLNLTSLTCGSIATQARNSMQGTLGVSGASPTAIAVTVTGPTVGGSAVSCGMAAGSTTQTGSPTSTPCTGSQGGDQLTVTLVFLSQAPVPAGPFTSMSLSAKGRFACEYT